VRPNVRGEAGPAVLRLARAEHHVPQALRGQGAMPLGLASTEGLGLARRAKAWTCEDLAVSGVPLWRLGAARWRRWRGAHSSRRDPWLSAERQCRMRPNDPTMASHAARCSDVAGRLPVIAFATCGSVVPTTNLLSLCFPISPDGAPAPRGVARRPVSSESAAASWLFGSRRQALIPLEHCRTSVARPNV